MRPTSKHLFFSFIFLAAACGGGSSPSSKSVVIDFDARMGGQQFACDRTFDNVGDTDATVAPLDLRFYISDVDLVTSDGERVSLALDQDGEWQYENVALLDFEDATGLCSGRGTAATNTNIRGKVAAGDYTGLSFVMGVPEALNHGDAATAPAPLNKTALWWSWNGGYKFIRYDNEVVQTGEEYRVHIGSMNCTGDGRGDATCADPNRVDVALGSWEAGSNTVLVDLDSVFVGSNLLENAPDTGSGCMSTPDDPDCAPVFDRFGLPFMGVEPAEQQVFRAE